VGEGFRTDQALPACVITGRPGVLKHFAQILSWLMHVAPSDSASGAPRLGYGVGLSGTLLTRRHDMQRGLREAAFEPAGQRFGVDVRVKAILVLPAFPAHRRLTERDAVVETVRAQMIATGFVGRFRDLLL